MNHDSPIYAARTTRNLQDHALFLFPVPNAIPMDSPPSTQIGDGVGGFSSGQLTNLDYFGYDLEAIGDVDGDGIVDLAAIGRKRMRP